MNSDDVDKIDRFFLYIEKELKERIRFFRNGSYGTYAQKYGVEKPFIIITIDGFESFCNEYLSTESKGDIFRAILREGMRAGIIFLLGNGSTRRSLYGLSTENIRPLAALGYESFERYDQVFGEYASTKEISQKDTFESPGRGLIKAGRKMYLLQSALPIGVAEDYDRYDALIAKCKEMGSAWTGKCAMPVPTVPADFMFDAFFQMAGMSELFDSKQQFPIGLNVFSAEPISVQMEDSYMYLILGDNSAERSNLVQVFLKKILYKNWSASVIGAKSIWKSWMESSSIAQISTVEELHFQCLELLKDIKNRNKESKPHFIIIDSLRYFYEMLLLEYSKEKNIGTFLHNIMEKGMDRGIYFIITADADKKTSMLYEPISGMTKMILSKCKNAIYIDGNISEQNWFDIDYQIFKALNYDLGLAHGSGTGMLLKKSGISKNDIVRVPLVVKEEDNS